MKLQKHQLTIPLTKIRSRQSEFLEWLNDQGIKYQIIKAMRQAPGWPLGWECMGPALEFNNIEDAMAFKLRWL